MRVNDKTIARVSLCCSVFGLLLLLIVSSFIEAGEATISGLDDAEERDVTVKGQVVSVRDFDDLAVVEVAEVKSVDVVVFDKRMLDLKAGDNVSVTGELRDYKGKKEIVAEKIRRES